MPNKTGTERGTAWARERGMGDTLPVSWSNVLTVKWGEDGKTKPTAGRESLSHVTYGEVIGA